MTTENMKNPSVVLLPLPTFDLDTSIQELQLQLGAVPWLQKVFGRAKEIATKNAQGESKREPMVYQGGKEYYPVMPSDTLQSYLFFRVRSGRVPTNYKPQFDSLYSVPVDLIVWADLKKIDPAKDYIFTEELIHDVGQILKRNANVTVVNIWDERAEDIFQGYTLNPHHRELLMYPYQAFRFELVVRYFLNCP